MNVLLTGKPQPGETLLDTFAGNGGERAPRPSRCRRAQGKHAGDLSDLRVGTIHGLCNDYLFRYRHRTRLGNAYTVLDDLTQQLLVNDYATQILRDLTQVGNRYVSRLVQSTAHPD
jgi:DNA helicase-2/ATP-dependent DNA helicase PcrA